MDISKNQLRSTRGEEGKAQTYRRNVGLLGKIDQKIYLTPSTTLIHISFKMEHGWFIRLKVSFQIFFEIPPCAKKVFFVSEFVILCKSPPLYQVNLILPKRT